MAGNSMVKTLFDNGHFYSPVVDPSLIRDRVGEIWRDRPQILGIDFNRAAHLKLLSAFPRWLKDFNYPMAADDATDAEGRPGFFLENDQFSNIDARALFVMLREFKPRRVIEVGSGFSSLLMADVKRRFLPLLSLQCIEPYPRSFLHDTSYGLELVKSKVEHVPMAFFESLRKGDFLFIDSSHVSKTGSDVNYLLFEVIPRLRPGVLVQVHDIFLPQDYPFEWVVKDNRSWNEQYLLQAYLMFNPKTRVVFGSSYVYHALPQEAADAIGPGVSTFGGSLWFETR
ncbi:MAG: class I SAM-dependent methyltransferase [Luteimonas sp.]